MTVIMGPAKSGKSTLLRALAGRLPDSARMYGEVHINGIKSCMPYGSYTVLIFFIKLYEIYSSFHTVLKGKFNGRRMDRQHFTDRRHSRRVKDWEKDNNFKNGKSGVHKILHNSFKAKETSIRVQVRRGLDEFTEFPACIMPSMSLLGKRAHWQQEF